MPKVKPIELDGSTLEGGGQLVRVALSLSAITGIPVHIYNIRANRATQGRSKQVDKPSGRGSRSKGSSRRGSAKVEGGLKESHLAALLYLAGQCGAYVEGAAVGSRELTFIPGADSYSGKKQSAKATNLVNFETNTIELQNPGSVWLILQAILPYLIFGGADSTSSISEQQTTRAAVDTTLLLTLRGGTNVSKSMSGEYAQHVLLPTLHRIGMPSIQVEVAERGWAGNASKIGKVRVKVPRVLVGGHYNAPFEVSERGEIEKIAVHIVAGDQESRTELGQGVVRVIAEHFEPAVPVNIEQMDDSGDPRRLYVLLVAHTRNGWRLGRDFLGSGRSPKNASERHKVIDQACQTVVRELRSEVKKGGCVDEYLQDQLVIFQACVDGPSFVDGGEWDDQRKSEEEECGDERGSLHTRTVRWVCRKMLGDRGMKFEPK